MGKSSYTVLERFGPIALVLSNQSIRSDAINSKYVAPKPSYNDWMLLRIIHQVCYYEKQ